MAKYVPKTRFIVNGCDMSSYVDAITYKMVAGHLDVSEVSLVGANLNVAIDPETGQKIITVSIGEDFIGKEL